MYKRGQFFLVGAFVIVGVLLGLTTVVNYVNMKNDREFFYDLSKEVGFETKKVMDYGVVNDVDSLNLIQQNFLGDYVDYIGQDKAVFVYGDKDGNYHGLYFTQGGVGSVGINIGGDNPTEVPLRGNVEETADVSVENGKVKVEIDGKTHEFKTREGQNLFYVIIKEDGDETIVASG